MVDTLPAISNLKNCIENTTKDKLILFMDTDCNRYDLLADSIIYYNKQQYSLSWEALRNFCDINDLKCSDRDLHTAILRTVDHIDHGCYGVENNSDGSIDARYTNTGDSYSPSIVWMQFDLDHMPDELNAIVSPFEYDLIILAYWAIVPELNEAIEYLEN